MTRRYSTEDRNRALKTLAANDDDIPQTSRQTGIPAATLRKWARRHQEERAERLYRQVERLQEELAENLLHLAAALQASIDGAPLNQVATALGTVIDRFLKLEEHLANSRVHKREQVIRVDFRYPDGSIHKTPPWANDDYEVESPLPRRGLRSPLWENGNGQDHHNGASTGRDEVLVAGAHVPDGEPGLARFEDDFAGYTGFVD